jgi:Bacterial conjugation TrbI-like protein
MNELNENNASPVEVQSTNPDGGHAAPPSESTPEGSAAVVTRGSQKKGAPDQKQIVMMAAGGIVVAIVAFVLVSIPHGQRITKSKSGPVAQKAEDRPGVGSTKSSVPVTESGPVQAGQANELLREQDVQRTATPGQGRTNMSHATTPAPTSSRTLGEIPPFEPAHDWQAPPYNPDPQQRAESGPLKSEKNVLAESSFIFVHNTASSNSTARSERAGVMVGFGLPTGTRLRARLETVATSALKLPTIAVIEYNYERDGQILIPAGAKALGRVEQADRTGFLSIRFETLLMPDGTEVPFEAVATDLHLSALRGKVQGKNTGKSLLARSLSGVGQAGTLLAGRGSLNQPFSEQDLIRERVATNIGDESDQEVTRLTLAEHIVVSVPAGTPIYVVLQHAAKQPVVATSGVSSAATINQNQDLLQVLQKQLAAPGSGGHPEQ